MKSQLETASVVYGSRSNVQIKSGFFPLTSYYKFLFVYLTFRFS